VIPAFGQILLVGNVDQSRMLGQTSIGEYGLGPSRPSRTARSFTTGISDVTLSSIYFGSGVQYGFGAGSLSISIYDSRFGAPGAPVVNGNLFASATGSAVSQPFYPSANITLQAQTTYWLVLSADQSPGATRYWWEWNATSSFSSDMPGASLPTSKATDLGDGYWQFFVPQENLPVDIRVIPVPEPRGLCVIPVLIGCWIGVRRRIMVSTERVA
jgi:hypothetical protein